MPKKKVEQSAGTVDEIVARAVKAQDGLERRRIAAKARSLGHELIKKPLRIGRPTKFSQEMADKIVKLVSEGKTLTKIGSELSISLQDVYVWLELYPEFLENYQKARKLMCISLIDSMLDQTESAEKEEALLLKVKAGVYQWVAARYNADQFSEKKNVQIHGAISHQHSHELSDVQKQRIAESWLLSKQAPAIEAETSGPDIPAVKLLEKDGVREIPPKSAKEIPVRKRIKPLQKHRDLDF